MEVARRVVGQQAGEKFWVLCLNRKNRLLKRVEVTSGTATAALAHPREVFRTAIRESASAVACVHNHPSRDPAPSAADAQVTRQLREAARTVDIELVDHVNYRPRLGRSIGPWFFQFSRRRPNIKLVVGDGFEPSEALASRFTVCPRWPLE